YEYDTTGLIVRAGELSLTRDPTTGLIASERIGALERTWQYNSFGEVVGGTVTASGRPLYEFRVVRDLLGRVLRRVERVQNRGDRTRAFTYDRADRLASVRDDGGRETRFVYDENGNLLRESSRDDEVVATYDGRDRLTRWGSTTYSYDSAGRLKSTTSPNGTSSYEFDGAGHLLSATLPSGTKVDYVIDGMGRRIGRSVNGRFASGY